MSSIKSLRIINNDNSLEDILLDAITYYEEETPAPIITGLSQTKVELNSEEQILIFGQNFNSNCEVYVNGYSCNVVSTT